MPSRCRNFFAAVGACALLWAPPAGSTEAGARSRVLRVCADPNNLPFSNQREQGFENELARRLAHELGSELQYFWWPQRRGFYRNTLKAGRCDVVMGVPAGSDPLLTTRPYYRSSYVFVQRKGAPRVRSLDDPTLRTLRIGVQLIGDDFANAPPAHALARRGIVNNVVGFMVYGNYADPDPARPIVSAVEASTIDLAIVWGPLAGYYAKSARVPLQLTPVSPLSDGDLRLSFAIALGVRRADVELKAALEAALAREQPAIAALLARYGIPTSGARP